MREITTPKTIINITQGLWSPSSFFKDYRGKEKPFLGVAVDKIQNLQEFDLKVTFLKTKPLYKGIDTERFLTISTSQGYVNNRDNRQIAYLPLSEIKNLAREVEE